MPRAASRRPRRGDTTLHQLAIIRAAASSAASGGVARLIVADSIATDMIVTRTQYTFIPTSAWRRAEFRQNFAERWLAMFVSPVPVETNYREPATLTEADKTPT